MINQELLNPGSIVVVGGSNDTQKPGGAVLRNLLDGNYKGNLYVTNLKESLVQGITSYPDPRQLPEVELAIIAIAAKYIPETVELLATEKKTRAFIILSAGFSEESAEGKELEKQVVSIIDKNSGSLIGPNCIGVLTPAYHGVFTKPIPKLDPKGCDFISGSGATACFIMEAGIPKGLTFSQVFSVGNSAQLGVEDILQYLDETYVPGVSSDVKLLYIETVAKPGLLLRHASSLIRKGCKIAAIKSGSSDAGSRAASSHTGALATSDVAVDALFRKAGIVRCYGREDLISVASVFMHPKLKGKNIAIVTHAGGPAVMLTDALSNGGLNVPHLEGQPAKELLAELFPGSSVANPIDFLATGTAKQLDIILNYIENKFDQVDGAAVIFGTPGLTKVHDVYAVIDEHMKKSGKPVFAILPSVVTAHEEVSAFLARGRISFPDEVIFGTALSKIYHTSAPAISNPKLPEIAVEQVRAIIGKAKSGYLTPGETAGLLDAAGIPRADEAVVTTQQKATESFRKLGLPVVMKVVGPVHKSDVGGVVLNVSDEETVVKEFNRMMRIKDATAVLIQPMLSGTELFIGATRYPKFGPVILCGLGGIFIEVLKDVAAGLSPLSEEEALSMVRSLKSYKIIQGVRGKEGVDESGLARLMVRLSALLEAAPEIQELDFNPVLGTKESLVVVDNRIRIEH